MSISTVWIVGGLALLQFPVKSLPVTQSRPVKEIHQIAIEDPYRWLEEQGKEVDDWINQQNEYTASFLNQRPNRPEIKKQLQKLMAIDSFSLPLKRGNRYFYMERKGNEEYKILYYKEGLEGQPVVLVNPTDKLEGGVVREWSVSKNGQLLVYSFSAVGNDKTSIYIREVSTGKDLPDVIPDVFFCNPVWAADNSGFWYTRPLLGGPKDEKLNMKIYFHRLGTRWEEDRLVFGESLAKEDLPLVFLSDNGRWLVVWVWATSKGPQSEVYVLDQKNLDKGFCTIVKDKPAFFEPTVHQNKLYLRTNYEAPCWRLLALDLGGLNQKEELLRIANVVISEEHSVLEKCEFLQDEIFVERLVDCKSEVSVYSLDGQPLRSVELPTMGSVDGFYASDKELFLSFSSFFFPGTILRYDSETNLWSIFKSVKVDIDFTRFVIEQVWFDSYDGTKVPMFLMYKKEGIEPNGKNPTMLYGYGGFNVSSTPSFDKDAMIFLERGGVYAVANIRGGGEFGEEWHKAGMLDRKQNVFNDFIAAAEWLIANKYTSSDKLAIFGWSNGGLLTAAALTQRPDLFRAVVIGAPVLDMLRFHQFHWGRFWIMEYGDPDKPEHLSHLLAYSPYHNVKKGVRYPATLILTADSDDRVHPLHAYKMTARLQAANKSDAPILLRVEKNTGHGGATSVSQSVDVYTDMWRFVFWQLEME